MNENRKPNSFQQIRPQGLLFESDDFVLFKKPTGWATHASSDWTMGICELMSRKVGHSLFVVHRLDVGTSGLLILAKSKEAAEKLSEKFRNHEIKKTYHFLTSKRPSKMEWVVESFLERGKDKVTRSVKGKEPNSKTSFKVIKDIVLEDRPLTLIRAEPLTGKPHQIRCHAMDSGVPLVGDPTYSGEPATRLFLAATHLEIDGQTFEDPTWEQDLNLGPIPSFLNLARLGLGQRKTLLNKKDWSSPESCWRWLHHEDPDLEIDFLGDVLWISLRNPKRHQEIVQNLPEILNLAPKRVTKCFLMSMTDRGQKSVSKELFEWTDGEFVPARPHHWTLSENGLTFQMKNDVGFSPGLFLDQKENRKWVQHNSADKSVLNLFAYTGAFSVNAAKGGAKSVCTVDVSTPFLNWSKENFKLNNINLDGHEFWNQDSLLFLKGCLKRMRTFDLILCDPPSVGRSKEGVFRIEKDWDRLLELCLNSLSPQGTLLFSTNFESWSQLEWLEKIEGFLKKSKRHIELLPGSRSPDFEPFQSQPAMKSFFLKNI